MSKLGKKPIPIPKETNIKVENGKLILTGPKGSKELTINDKIFSASISDDKNLILKQIKKKEFSNVMWGTTRSIIQNAVIGVTTGHEKILELSGVGFRANLKGNILNLQLGFSHDIDYDVPKEVKVECPKQNIIKLSSFNKEILGATAAKIRSYRKPEPFKGKGIKYENEYIFRKEGKKK